VVAVPPITLYTTCKMNDINWRNIDEDKSLFLEENKGKRIIVLTTNGLIWDSFTHYVNPNTYVLEECGYKVELYAYYTFPN
jgi:hypothetical protein